MPHPALVDVVDLNVVPFPPRDPPELQVAIPPAGETTVVPEVVKPERTDRRGKLGGSEGSVALTILDVVLGIALECFEPQSSVYDRRRRYLGGETGEVVEAQLIGHRRVSEVTAFDSR